MGFLSNLKKQIVSSDKNYLFLDCEWSNNKNKSICQIALIQKNGKTKKDFNYYINPNDGFDQNCVSVNHITKIKVKNCPTFDNVWSEIENYFINSIIVRHNVQNADLDAIVKNLQRYKINIPELYYIDTYQVSKSLINSYVIKNYKLSTLCNYFEIELNNHHNAIDDAYACLSLFEKLVHNYKFNINDYITRYQFNDFNFKPYVYNSELNREISTFLGVLNGIGMDNKIDKEEKDYIIKWRDDHMQFNYDTEIKNIINIINSILSDNIITLDELNILKSNISTYVNQLNSTPETLATQELQGIINGIESDSVINEQEILTLREWLYQNTFLKGHFPYDSLFKEIESILEDNIITEEEISNLKKVFVQIKNPVSLINKEIVIFNNTSFCLSGDFAHGTKKEIENHIISKGGTIDKNVKKTTNYLVLGNEGSQRYSNGNYGTKFKKAKDYNIPVIKEEQLFNL